MTDRTGVDPSLLHQQAQSAALEALTRADDVDDVVSAVAPFEVRGTFTPDAAMLELAVDALDLADVPGADLLEYEGLRERYLPEIEFRGRVEHRNSQWAIYAAACLHGGLEPDFGGDTGWWRAPLWIYTCYALTLFSRAAAERLNITVPDVARQIAQRHGIELAQPNTEQQ